VTDSFLIDTQAALDDLVARLASEPILAVDCEMDAMYAYRTKICLLQLGWDGGDVLIDVMVDLDRSGLGAIFADPAVVKVFHGGENDIGLMAAHWGFGFAGIFDTMAAAQVLGREKVGLAALLEQHFDVTLSKKFQKADWRVRPLPADQAEYARLDVRHLLSLRALLLAELEELQRVEEAESEFGRIASAKLEDRPFDPDSWARIKGVKELPANRRAIMRELCIVRDAIAMRLNRAPYRVVREMALLDIARRRPKDLGQLRRIRGVNRSLPEDDLVALLEAVDRGRDAEVPDFPRAKRPWNANSSGLSPEQQGLFDALRAWRAQRADKRGVQVARVATNVLLSAIARARPQSRDALAQVDGMESWRLREYGDAMLEVIERHAAAEKGS
jgi:ribonuclease D